jgi:hypothetical protein
LRCTEVIDVSRTSKFERVALATLTLDALVFRFHMQVKSSFHFQTCDITH